MKKLNIAIICFLMLAGLSVKAQAQKKQEVLNFIENLPTIEYGTLPYWHGFIENVGYKFIHGFAYNEDDTINNLNNHLMQFALCDSSYIINKGEKVQINMENVEYRPKYNFEEYTYVSSLSNETIKGEFYPPLFASAKSIYQDKYYIVYLWKASMTENVYYYALLFDKNGNLFSYQHLDYWMLGFPTFPYCSAKNMIRNIDYPKSMCAFLPNGLLLINDFDVMMGGGAYELVYINTFGHYEIIRKWLVDGQLESVKAGEFVNYVRENWDENGKKIISPIDIPFVVHDKDGYANIRAEANGNAKVIRTINDGDMVWGTYLANGWCKIAFTADSNGKIVEGGYIHSSRLEKISDPKNDEFIKMPSREEWEKKLKQ